MKRVRDYRYVYERWYKMKCKQNKQEPMTLGEYFKRVPLQEILRIKGYLNEGKTP